MSTRPSSPPVDPERSFRPSELGGHSLPTSARSVPCSLSKRSPAWRGCKGSAMIKGIGIIVLATAGASGTRRQILELASETPRRLL